MSKPILPAGFRTAGHACGIKSDPTKLDLALFVADGPCTTAGVFTQNRVVGAPVKVNRERVPSSTVRAVIINSGCSNACTGDRGIMDAKRMTATLAHQLGCADNDVLVCSTGVIGQFLPIEKIQYGILDSVPKLDSSAESFEAAARGMMTTDTIPKQVMREVTIDGKKVTISGACKGAAMIAPNMATMLAVIMTDARLSQDVSSTRLKTAVDKSFNCISVDQHTSTSDTATPFCSSPTEHRASPVTTRPNFAKP
jgi:glutamate N-acetyltransferase/amino-acid N-acetyltransferase